LDLELCSGPEPGQELTGLCPMGQSAGVANWRRGDKAAPEPGLSNPGCQIHEPGCRNCVHRIVYPETDGAEADYSETVGPETVGLETVKQTACPLGFKKKGPGV